MRKRTKFGILTATLIFGIIAYAVLAQSPVWLSISSPNKTYTVELTGNKARPRSPFIEHETRFNLLKNGQVIIRNAYVDSYDWFDSGFEDSYPEHTWVNESALRFGLNVAESERGHDSLAISNNTGKTIKYLKITARDMVFVFDIPPNTNFKLSVPHQRWLSWIACEGEFVDGQPILWNGVNFFHGNTIREPLRYCVSINDKALKIESPQMDGFDGSGTGDNPNIPRAVNCNP
ncbi:MAG: hypothetical protein H0V27_11540 [Pyrinomonadaceae bacterium]|nr:hypothetical protein [Pyrinomonadaceae bacterium]